MNAIHLDLIRDLRRIGLGAAVLALAVIAAPHLAVGDTIWGQQGGNSQLLTAKIDLDVAKTITGVWYENTDNYCIWSGVPTASVVLCGRAQDQVGTVLPPGKGYFLIPALSATNNMRVLVKVQVE